MVVNEPIPSTLEHVRVKDTFRFFDTTETDGAAFIVQVYMLLVLLLLLGMVLVLTGLPLWKEYPQYEHYIMDTKYPSTTPLYKEALQGTGHPAPPARFFSKKDFENIYNVKKFEGRHYVLDMHEKTYMRVSCSIPCAMYGKQQSLFDIRFPPSTKTNGMSQETIDKEKREDKRKS